MLEGLSGEIWLTERSRKPELALLRRDFCSQTRIPVQLSDFEINLNLTVKNISNQPGRVQLSRRMFDCVQLVIS